MLAGNFIGIEGMQRLSHLVQHEVRGIHHVIDWTQADSRETFLQPVRRLAHFNAFDAHARVTRTSIAVLHRHLDWQGIALHFERIHIRFGQSNILSMRFVVSIQVARYAVVRSSVIAVRRDVHFDDIVVLEMEILFRGQTDRRILR